MSIKVSVCIPIYGVEKYIERCVRSLFEQTMLEEIEFIFVNDCTLDKSIEVLESVLQEYPHRKEQVKIIHHEKNQGLVGARKTALKYVQGEYVIHCDSDDWVDVTMYEKLYNKAKETNADMVYCDYIRYVAENDQSLISLGDVIDSDEIIKNCIEYKSLLTLWNRLYRKEIIEKLDMNLLPDSLSYGEDIIHNFYLLQNCKIISKINEPLYFYRTNPTSICSNIKKGNIQSRRNVFRLQFLLDQLVSNKSYQSAMEERQRIALYAAISSGVITAREWHRLWKPAKRGMWRDKRWNIVQKLIFYAACINFTLTSFVFKLLKGQLKASKQ